MIDELKPLWNYQHRPYEQTTRGGKGVQYMNGRVRPWRAYVHVKGKKVHIGYYDTEVEARKARLEY